MAAMVGRFRRRSPSEPTPIAPMIDYAREQARIADEIDARQADVARRIRMLQTQVRVMGAHGTREDGDDHPH